MPIDKNYESWRSSLPHCPEEVYIEALKKAQNHFRKLIKSKNIVDIELASERLEKTKSDVLDQIKKYRRAQLDYRKKLLPQELICDVFQNLEVREVDKCRSVNLWWNNTVLANDYVLPRKWTEIPRKEEVPTKNRTTFEDDSFLIPRIHIYSEPFIWWPFIPRTWLLPLEFNEYSKLKFTDFGNENTPIQVNSIQQLIQSKSEETWEFPKKLKKNNVYKNEKPSYKVAQKKVYCQINQPRIRSNRFN